MNKLNKVLEDIKNLTGLEIINKSFEGVSLFNTSNQQPFKFDITIEFNGIKGLCSFELHFPSLYVKAEDITEFSNIINQVVSYINQLNAALKADYSSEWVKQ